MATKEQVVAYLGPRASYTHQATIKQFPESEYKIVPLIKIEDVFAEVQAGKASHGVVPFENSSNGFVDFTLDLFADPHGRYSDIVVCSEIYLPVHHCLLGYAPKNQEPLSKTDITRRSTEDEAEISERSGQATPTQSAQLPAKPRTIPRYDLSHIRDLYSHPQAWGQCEVFLSTHLKQVDRQDVSSTAKAAELAAADKSGSIAAISSKIAAELNGLDILAENIEDQQDNATRFLVLRRRQDVESPEEDREMSKQKALVSFKVDHSEPGSLADCLDVFKKYGLNFTSINARPSGEAQWHYIFFVEFMGCKKTGGGSNVDEALQELARVARSLRWLGRWSSSRNSDSKV